MTLFLGDLEAKVVIHRRALVYLSLLRYLISMSISRKLDERQRVGRIHDSISFPPSPPSPPFSSFFSFSSFSSFSSKSMKYTEQIYLSAKVISPTSDLSLKP